MARLQSEDPLESKRQSDGKDQSDGKGQSDSKGWSRAGAVGDIAASVKGEMSDRLRGAMGNAALLGAVGVLVATAWVAFIAGLVALLAPLVGLAAAIFAVAALVFCTALVLLALVKRRTRLQQERAAWQKMETRRQGQAALVAALPHLLQQRSGILVVGVGVALGALIMASLGHNDAE